ncbi:hypothetical protein DID73_02570, partial [Candidatus Marinamargulisbacteria bacterium SCGC AG-343-K17]
MISRLVLISIFILNSIAFSQTKSTQLDLDNLTPEQITMGQQFFDKSSKKNRATKNSRRKPIVNQKKVQLKQNNKSNILFK